MNTLLRLGVLLVLGHGYVLSLGLPDYIKPCPRNENFNDCALKNGRLAAPLIIKGDPEYGIPLLDPWYQDDITAKEGSLTISAINFTIVGLSTGQLDSFKADFESMSVTVEYKIPELKFQGNYSISGRLVGIPINGHGPFVSVMYDVILKYTTDFNTKMVDGKAYGTPKNYQMAFIPTNMKFFLHNLFGSNKQINEAINIFFNENWKIVMQEAGKPVTQLLGNVFHSLLTDLGEKIPIDEVFSA